MNSAVVLGCGHASFLMEVNVMKPMPHVHIHFLTDKQEYAELGYGKVELCCHGCGASLLMYYSDSPAQRRAHLKVRDDFMARHTRCPHVISNGHCSNWRSKFEFVDIRNGIEIHPQEWQFPSEKRDKLVERSS